MTTHPHHPTSSVDDPAFVPFVFLRGGQAYRVSKRGPSAWLHFWHYSGQWCMQRALPLQCDIDEFRKLAIPDAQAAHYDREQRRLHPHYYNADGTLKR